MTIFEKRKRKKNSVEFTERNHKAVQEYADATGSTFSHIANYLVDCMLGMPSETRSEMSQFCSLKDTEISGIINDVGEFQRQDFESRRMAYQQLGFFFSGIFNIPSFGKQNKQKASVEFTIENYNLIVEYAQKADSTFGRIVNYLIGLTLTIPKSVKEEIASYCSQKVSNLDQSVTEAGEFERIRINEIRLSYLKMNYFFSNGFPSDAGPAPDIRRVFLKDSYVDFPSEWIILEGLFGDPSECTAAHVVEVRNGGKYGLPHFILFSNKKNGTRFTREEEELIDQACMDAFPLYKVVLQNRVEPPSISMLDPRYKEAVAKHLESPYPGLYDIIATDDLWYRETDPHPFGCVVVRTTKSAE